MFTDTAAFWEVLYPCMPYYTHEQQLYQPFYQPFYQPCFQPFYQPCFQPYYQQVQVRQYSSLQLKQQPPVQQQTKHTLKPLQKSEPQPKSDESRQNKLYNDIMLVVEKCFPENKDQVAHLIKKIIDTLYPQISANKETIANGIVLALSAAIAAVIPSKPVNDTIIRVVTPAIHNALDRYF